MIVIASYSNNARIWKSGFLSSRKMLALSTVISKSQYVFVINTKIFSKIHSYNQDRRELHFYKIFNRTRKGKPFTVIYFTRFETPKSHPGSSRWWLLYHIYEERMYAESSINMNLTWIRKYSSLISHDCSSLDLLQACPGTHTAFSNHTLVGLPKPFDTGKSYYSARYVMSEWIALVHMQCIN